MLKVTIRKLFRYLEINIDRQVQDYRQTSYTGRISRCGSLEGRKEYWRRQILCRRPNIERGIVPTREASVPRSVEINPSVLRSEGSLAQGGRDASLGLANQGGPLVWRTKGFRCKNAPRWGNARCVVHLAFLAGGKGREKKRGGGRRQAFTAGGSLVDVSPEKKGREEGKKKMGIAGQVGFVFFTCGRVGNKTKCKTVFRLFFFLFSTLFSLFLLLFSFPLFPPAQSVVFPPEKTTCFCFFLPIQGGTWKEKKKKQSFVCEGR